MLIQPHTSRDNLVLTCNLGRWFSSLKKLPGRHRWDKRELIFQPSGANIAHIMDINPEAEWAEGAATFRDKFIELKQQEHNAREEKKEALEDESGYEHKTVPYDHQKRAFVISREKEAYGLFMEQGTGKTKVVIDNAAYLFERGKIDRVIVVAKNGVHHNWALNEIPAHLPDRIPRTVAFYTAGKTTNVEPKMRPGKLHFMCFAVEGFRSERAQELLVDWLESGRCLFVIDESSTIKNWTAQRTKFLCKVAHKAWESVSGELLRHFNYEHDLTDALIKGAVYRRIMTGTPITRGQENLFSQFYFLNPNILGHKNYTTYRAEYCIMGGFEGRAIIGYKKTEELQDIVDAHSFRVLKSECLDLPPKVYKRRQFDLAPGQRKLYDAYRRTAIEELQELLRNRDEDWFLTKGKELVITKALRLQQITCGLMPDNSGERIPGDNNPRLDILFDELEEYEGKTIIWTRFKRDQQDIFQHLGKRAVRYFGGVPEDERIEATHRFVKDDRIQFFVASQAAAYGHSLPAIGAIYHSQTSSLDIRLQSEDRCHGINRTIGPTATYTDLEALRTVDQKIIKALRDNKEIADTILKDPISLFMEEAS